MKMARVGSCIMFLVGLVAMLGGLLWLGPGMEGPSHLVAGAILLDSGWVSLNILHLANKCEKVNTKAKP